MAYHKNLNSTDIHTPLTWSYADATARLAATGFTSTDLYKFARQEDDDSIWMLTATAPTWSNIATGVLSNIEYIDFDTDPTIPAHAEGRFFWDNANNAPAYHTDISGVTNQIGQELYIKVRNNSGGTINNGEVCYLSGAVGQLPTIAKAKADAVGTSHVIAVATHDLDNNTNGYVTTFGLVRDFDTSSFSDGDTLYLSATTAGALTNTAPAAPNYVVHLGSVTNDHPTSGSILIDIHLDHSSRIQAEEFTSMSDMEIDDSGAYYIGDKVTDGSWRMIVESGVLKLQERISSTWTDGAVGSTPSIKSYSFISPSGSTGTFYVAGYYDAPAADANLTQASPSTTHGAANGSYAAHAFIVAGGAGSVDTGVIGIQVTGTSINDAGTRTAADTENIVTDITALATDQYVESSKKWIGQVTIQFYTVSGSPTTYNADFNYGFCKYDDMGNRNFTVTDFEAVGLAGANDSSFNVSLLHHKSTGWTYSAAAFVPGNGFIVDMNTDHSTEQNLVNGDSFAYKRSSLSQAIVGGDSEGVVIKIVTGANSAVQDMDAHVGFNFT
jgi:hypothetical protein